MQKRELRSLRRMAIVLPAVLFLTTACETFGVESFGTDPGATTELCGQRWTDASGENFDDNPTGVSRTWSIAPDDCGNNSLPTSANLVGARAEILVEFGQAGNFASCGFIDQTALAGNVWATFGHGIAPCDDGCFLARGRHWFTIPAGTLSTDDLLAPEDCIINT
ncbi:MAG: hypothetical protein R2707_15730 [Acidimicrobiales bacterium]